MLPRGSGEVVNWQGQWLCAAHHAPHVARGLQLLLAVLGGLVWPVGLLRSVGRRLVVLLVQLQALHLGRLVRVAEREAPVARGLQLLLVVPGLGYSSMGPTRYRTSRPFFLGFSRNGEFSTDSPET